MTDSLDAKTLRLHHPEETTPQKLRDRAIRLTSSGGLGYEAYDFLSDITAYLDAARPSNGGWKVPDDCDGIEQDAFEEWAQAERFDMAKHPLYWLFLNPETSAARRGWRAGIRHARDRFLAAQSDFANRITSSIETETVAPPAHPCHSRQAPGEDP